ncbi:MAG: hypothetical protein U0R49_01230 [Fimbriimonadales bacterium]
MKKIVLLAAAALAGSAVAQAPFTIVSPKQGAKLRETVRVVMPKGSVPNGTFIGVSIDGKFVEAITPDEDKKTGDMIYNLNTKAKKIPDGDHTLGVTLFVNSGGQPQIADRSEVKIHVGNHEGITVPADGLKLGYRFAPGFNSIYNLRIGSDASVLSEARNKMGGRAAQIPGFSETARLLVAVDDVKPNGLGLVRIQFEPYKGKDKDYVVVTMPGETEPTKQVSETFAPLYRLMDRTGREVYADEPMAFDPLSSQKEIDLYVLLPLPLLPDKPKKIGDTWQGGIAFSSPMNARTTGVGSSKMPAVGTLTSVEWEMGQPCARIDYKLEMSEKTKETLKVAGREFVGGDRSAFYQTIWFSLKEGRIIRSELTIEGDTKISLGGGTQGGGTQGGGNTGSGGGAPRVGGGTGSSGAGVGVITPAGGQGARRPSIGGGESGGTFMPGGQGGGTGGGGGSFFIRQKLHLSMVLDRG